MSDRSEGSTEPPDKQSTRVHYATCAKLMLTEIELRDRSFFWQKERNTFTGKDAVLFLYTRNIVDSWTAGIDFGQSLLKCKLIRCVSSHRAFKNDSSAYYVFDQKRIDRILAPVLSEIRLDCSSKIGSGENSSIITHDRSPALLQTSDDQHQQSQQQQSQPSSDATTAVRTSVTSSSSSGSSGSSSVKSVKSAASMTSDQSRSRSRSNSSADGSIEKKKQSRTIATSSSSLGSLKSKVRSPDLVLLKQVSCWMRAAERLTAQDLEIVACALWKDAGIIGDRRWRMTLYKDCFVGRDAVSFLVEHGFASNIHEAVEICNVLVTRRIISHVTGEHRFNDDYLYYRFNCDPKLTARIVQRVPLTMDEVRPHLIPLSPRQRQRTRAQSQSSGASSTLSDPIHGGFVGSPSDLAAIRSRHSRVVGKKPKHSSTVAAGVAGSKSDGSGKVPRGRVPFTRADSMPERKMLSSKDLDQLTREHQTKLHRHQERSKTATMMLGSERGRQGSHDSDTSSVSSVPGLSSTTQSLNPLLSSSGRRCGSAGGSGAGPISSSCSMSSLRNSKALGHTGVSQRCEDVMNEVSRLLLRGTTMDGRCMNMDANTLASSAGRKGKSRQKSDEAYKSRQKRKDHVGITPASAAFGRLSVSHRRKRGGLMNRFGSGPSEYQAPKGHRFSDDIPFYEDEFSHKLISDRWYHFRQYQQCLIASELCDWLYHNRYVETREIAAQFGECMRREGYLTHVVEKHKSFKDEFLFFRFTFDIQSQMCLVNDKCLFWHSTALLARVTQALIRDGSREFYSGKVNAGVSSSSSAAPSSSLSSSSKKKKKGVSERVKHFTGQTLVRWMTEHDWICQTSNSDECVYLGNCLLQRGFIYDVSLNGCDFHNSPFYMYAISERSRRFDVIKDDELGIRGGRAHHQKRMKPKQHHSYHRSSTVPNIASSMVSSAPAPSSSSSSSSSFSNSERDGRKRSMTLTVETRICPMPEPQKDDSDESDDDENDVNGADTDVFSTPLDSSLVLPSLPTKKRKTKEDYNNGVDQGSSSSLKNGQCKVIETNDEEIIGERSSVDSELNMDDGWTHVEVLKALQTLFESVNCDDRRYHKKVFRNCFVGSEAVKCLMCSLSLSCFDSVCLGQALLELDLIRHVMDSQPFLNGPHFYRFRERNCDEFADRVLPITLCGLDICCARGKSSVASQMVGTAAGVALKQRTLSMKQLKTTTQGMKNHHHLISSSSHLSNVALNSSQTPPSLVTSADSDGSSSHSSAAAAGAMNGTGEESKVMMIEDRNMGSDSSEGREGCMASEMESMARRSMSDLRKGAEDLSVAMKMDDSMLLQCGLDDDEDESDDSLDDEVSAEEVNFMS